MIAYATKGAVLLGAATVSANNWATYITPTTFAGATEGIDIAIHPSATGGYSANASNGVVKSTYLQASNASVGIAGDASHGGSGHLSMRSQSRLVRRSSEVTAAAFAVALVAGVVSLIPGVKIDSGLYGSVALLVAGVAGYVATSRQAN